MEFYQSPANVAAKGASAIQFSRWRDEGVDPELPQPNPVPEVDMNDRPRKPCSQFVLESLRKHGIVTLEGC